MYALITQNKEKIKYFVLFGIVITILLLVSVVFKNDENVKNTKTNFALENKDLSLIIEFVFSKIIDFG